MVYESLPTYMMLYGDYVLSHEYKDPYTKPSTGGGFACDRDQALESSHLREAAAARQQRLGGLLGEVIIPLLGGGFKYLLFLSLPGEMMKFD